MIFAMFPNTTVSESDRRLIIIAVVILILFFLILGLIGMLIRFVMKKQAEKIDGLCTDVAKYHVVNEKTFKPYAYKKNDRLFFKQSIAPICILFVALLFYLIYAGITGQWGYHYWSDYQTIFYIWDFGNPKYYSNFWGMQLLSSWPELINHPHFVKEYYPSYILCTLTIIGVTYFLVVSQAYLSRFFMIGYLHKRVYKKTLEGFNAYDDLKENGPQVKPTEEQLKEFEKLEKENKAQEKRNKKL